MFEVNTTSMLCKSSRNGDYSCSQIVNTCLKPLQAARKFVVSGVPFGVEHVESIVSPNEAGKNGVMLMVYLPEAMRIGSILFKNVCFMFFRYMYSR